MPTLLLLAQTAADTADHSHSSIHAMLHQIFGAIIFGVIGIVLLLVGFKLFDWITPKIDVQHELAEKGNIAVAIVVAAILLGLSIILTRVVGG
ncbi:MAG: DUF350 domain-containing protein [Phycisphaerales bacterium]